MVHKQTTNPTYGPFMTHLTEECAKWKLVNGHKIVTQFWAKPIPTARWDWSATEEEYDYGRPIGTGATEQEAIDDLLEKLEGR
jgi:hypothetical protein